MRLNVLWLVVALAGFAAALGGYSFLTGGRGRLAPIPLSTRLRQAGVAAALALVPLLFLIAGLSYGLNPLLEGPTAGLVLAIGVVLVLLGLRADRRRAAATAATEPRGQTATVYLARSTVTAAQLRALRPALILGASAREHPVHELVADTDARFVPTPWLADPLGADKLADLVRWAVGQAPGERIVVVCDGPAADELVETIPERSSWGGDVIAVDADTHGWMRVARHEPYGGCAAHPRDGRSRRPRYIARHGRDYPCADPGQ